MAKLDTPVHSDDDFDLLYDAQSVSDVSDGRDTSSSAPESSIGHGQLAGAQRTTGPHEVPDIPFIAAQRDVPKDPEQIHSSTALDEALLSSGNQLHAASIKSRGNIMSEGLQYTKSMYNKMWNKDALIAVMG